jgi:hypothetical protein
MICVRLPSGARRVDRAIDPRRAIRSSPAATALTARLAWDRDRHTGKVSVAVIFPPLQTIEKLGF